MAEYDRLRQALVYLAAEKYEKALKFIEKLLKKHPKDHDLWLKKVLALTKLGQKEQALLSLEELNKLNPVKNNVLSEMVKFFYELGHPEEALKVRKRREQIRSGSLPRTVLSPIEVENRKELRAEMAELLDIERDIGSYIAHIQYDKKKNSDRTHFSYRTAIYEVKTAAMILCKEGVYFAGRGRVHWSQFVNWEVKKITKVTGTAVEVIQVLQVKTRNMRTITYKVRRFGGQTIDMFLHAVERARRAWLNQK